MLEAMAHFSVEPFSAYFALGRAPSFSDRPRLAQAHILRTSDGGLIALHLSSLEKFWQELTRALGARDLEADPRFATRQSRIDHYEARCPRRAAPVVEDPDEVLILRHFVQPLQACQAPRLSREKNVSRREWIRLSPFSRSM